MICWASGWLVETAREMESAVAALGVDELQCPRLACQQFEQLAGGTIQPLGRPRPIKLALGENVEGFGQQGWEIWMAGVDRDPPRAASRLPTRRPFGARLADGQGEVEA